MKWPEACTTIAGYLAAAVMVIDIAQCTAHMFTK